MKKKKHAELPPSTTISNCNFEATVNFDVETVKTVSVVAQALLNLTELFKAQNITIESLLKITGDKP